MSAKKKAAHSKALAQGDRLGSLCAELLVWYHGNKRDLPWRATRDPYAIWVSEVMLQQTRVETVLGYYERFLSAFPTLTSLADADVGDVLAKWSGLGYYRRARLLHRGAQSVRASGLPTTARELEAVPGIGRYTAGAIASIAHGEAAPLVDGNVARVLARWFAIDVDVSRGAGRRRVWSLATDLVATRHAKADPGAFNQALMELGATVCTPRSPRCAECPVHAHCLARASGKEHALPKLAPKPRPREWRRVALVVHSGERVLLGRRAGGALMEGLWEPPMVDLDERTAELAVAELANALDLASIEARRVKDVVHVLTHRRMSVAVFRGELPTRARLAAGVGKLDPYDAFVLADKSEREKLASATLTKKLIVATE